MVECVFTIDYEIYGNGRGALRELVYKPAHRLQRLFDKWQANFVAFVEAAELERIAELRTDEAIEDVQRQVREMHDRGHEVALHLHPQWYNAVFSGAEWRLDYREYNLCTLPAERIGYIVDRAINYLRGVLSVPDYTPFTFRAGNWLFQPSATVSTVLAGAGIKIDSSVAKGVRQRFHRLDYRPALRNGYYWRFGTDVNHADPSGPLLEIPTYTRMVPFWKMLTAKRVGLQRKTYSMGQPCGTRWHRLLDRLRLRYPLKFDFCRMTFAELTATVDEAIRRDQAEPSSYKPLVAIGHTKDLEDLDTVERFLQYLGEKNISISTFPAVYRKCLEVREPAPVF